MVTRNDEVGLAFYGTFENAVVRIIIKNRKRFLGSTNFEKVFSQPSAASTFSPVQKNLSIRIRLVSLTICLEVKLAISPEATSSKILAGLLVGKFKPETMTLVSSTTLSIGWFGSILVNEALDVFLL